MVVRSLALPPGIGWKVLLLTVAGWEPGTELLRMNSRFLSTARILQFGTFARRPSSIV